MAVVLKRTVQLKVFSAPLSLPFILQAFRRAKMSGVAGMLMDEDDADGNTPSKAGAAGLPKR